MQLPLAIQLNENLSFDNFFYPDDPVLLASLKAVADGEGEPVSFLWAGAGGGKSHLLQATCQRAAESGMQVIYLPLLEMQQYSPDVLSGMEDYQLLCIDDVQLIAGNADWEQALFGLFNRVRERQGSMLFSALASPRELGIQLPDLVSRLEWGPVYQLPLLDDEQKKQALRQRAANKGLEMPEEVARYLLSRFPRDLNSLFDVLDRLDEQSLINQRRLTIPFVREVFADSSAG